MTDKRYNGWTNYETWNVNLWLSNDEATYTQWTTEARDAYINAAGLDSNRDHERDARIELAKRLKEAVSEHPLLEEASMYADLLRSALDEVDWMEIADNWLMSSVEDYKGRDWYEGTPSARS